jgi:hypothetical protein
VFAIEAGLQFSYNCLNTPTQEPELIAKIAVAFICALVASGEVSRASVSAPRPLMLISDVDDTIKRTNVLSLTGLILNGPRTTNPFGAMNILYNAWICDPLRMRKNDHARCMARDGAARVKNRKMAYVTAAPWKLQNFARSFLRDSGFPTGIFKGHNFEGQEENFVTEIQVEELMGLPGTLEFKVEAITALMKAHSGFDFILIGDNGEKDVAAYDAIGAWAARNLPRATVHSYIHQVYNYRDGVKPKDDQAIYVTAADLATEFYRQGYLSEVALAHVIDQTFRAMKLDEISVFPKYMDCRHIVNPARFPKIPDGLTPSTAARIQKLLGILKSQCSR